MEVNNNYHLKTVASSSSISDTIEKQLTHIEKTVLKIVEKNLKAQIKNKQLTLLPNKRSKIYKKIRKNTRSKQAVTFILNTLNNALKDPEHEKFIHIAHCTLETMTKSEWITNVLSNNQNLALLKEQLLEKTSSYIKTQKTFLNLNEIIKEITKENHLFNLSIIIGGIWISSFSFESLFTTISNQLKNGSLKEVSSIGKFIKLFCNVYTNHHIPITATIKKIISSFASKYRNLLDPPTFTSILDNLQKNDKNSLTFPQKNSFQEQKIHILNYSNLILESSNIEKIAKIFAKNLFSIAFNRFSKLSFYEFYKYKKKLDTENLSFLTDYFEDLSISASLMILNPKNSIFQSAKMISFWIHVCYQLTLLKDFHSSMAIETALQQTSICRLKNVWDLIPSEDKTLFLQLEQLFCFKSSYQNLRNRIKFYKYDLHIPYLGLILSDLEYTLQISTRRTSSQKDLFNISKIKQIYLIFSHSLNVEQKPLSCKTTALTPIFTQQQLAFIASQSNQTSKQRLRNYLRDVLFYVYSDRLQI